jgi:hypothetical protein
VNTPARGASKTQEVDPMLRKLTPLLLLVPLAARAHSSDEDRWPGDDQYSSQPWDGEDGHADGYAAQQQYENPPPPPDDEYGANQYATAPVPVDEYVGPSMADFRSGLRPYGRWFWTADYGWVWRPRHVGYRWQPYWDGRWAWTTAGWTWVSDEPWGWATYHYGRWATIDGMGWVWLPGRVWAPAWVAWRWGGGYAGWCPLGPRGVVYVQPRQWVFVESPHFLAPVRQHVVPINVVRTVWTNAQPLRVVRPTPRAGPPPRIVEQHTRVPVRVVPIVEAPSRTATRPLTSGAIPVWRPRTTTYPRPVAPAAPGNPPARAERPGIVTPGGTVVRGEPRALPAEPRPLVERRLPDQPRPVQQQPRVEQPTQMERQPRWEQPSRAQQPVRVEQPARMQPPMRVEQPTRVQQPTRVEQPARVQQPARVEQPARVQQPARSEQPARAEQRPAPAQPVRPAPPPAAPARRAEHEGADRPAAEHHGRPLEAARDREKN